MYYSEKEILGLASRKCYAAAADQIESRERGLWQQEQQNKKIHIRNYYDMKHHHQHQQNNRNDSGVRGSTIITADAYAAAAAHRTNNNNPPVRLLQWDDEIENCWREIYDENIIYNKIRRIVKEYQNIIGKGKPPSQGKKPITMTHQQRGTTIFQNQDGSRVPSTKKPRLNTDGGTAIVTDTNSGNVLIYSAIM